MAISVHLDTDIGDDIDDAFCVALLLCSPEIQLKSITTVLNDTAHRADQCRELCDAAGQKPTIVGGSRSVITRRPPPGALTRTVEHSAERRTDAKADMPLTLATLATARRNCDALLTIGPLTNLAMSLVADPDVSRFPRYIAMAGEVLTPSFAEWNIRVDPEAAAIVCDAAISIDFVPWRIGIDTKLSPDEQGELDRATNPVTSILNDYRKQFRKHSDRQEMFDPMTVVALLHEDWFTWERGRLTVETRGDATYGYTPFARDPAGPHRVAVAVNADRAKRFLLKRLCDH